MITVLTPTYNRAHTLIRVYQSLSAQTDLRFEWLVVDDGSTDETQGLLKSLLPQASFAMRIVGQANGGKHVAINTGSRLAQGEWILILDSDDALTSDAIATVNTEIVRNPGPDILGVCFRKAFFDGELIGEKDVQTSPLFLHPTEAGELFKGDLAYIFRRSSLQSRPFPIILGERFVPELYIWNKIGDDGKILFFPDKAIYLCDYMPDGYSANFSKNLQRNPKGFLIYYRSQFCRERSMLRKLKCLIRSLQCFCYVLLNKVKL